MSSWKSPAAWAVFAAGLGLMLLRLVGLDDAPFINDEPQFLTAAWAQWADGFVRVSPLVGSTAHHYGPSVLWLYALTQKLLGRSALMAIATMCTIVTASQVVCAWGLTVRLLGLARARDVLSTDVARATFGALLLLTGSSPHQHFWSRLAWDQLTLALPFLVVGLLAFPAMGRERRFAIGALLGFAISSHPMVVIFAGLAATAATLVGERRPGQWAINGALVGVPMVLVNVPWLSVFLKEPDGPPVQPVALTASAWLEVFRAPSAARLGYFFDAEWPTAHLTPLDAVGDEWLLIGIATITIGGLLVALLRDEARLFALMGAAVIVGYPVFYARRALVLQPHYQFPTGWVTVAAVAVLLTAWKWRRDRLGVGLTALGVATVLGLGTFQTSVLLRWRELMHANGGTRGIHYASLLSEQLQVSDQLCALPAGQWAVFSQTTLFPVALEYHLRLDPRCQDKHFTVCGYGRGCQPAPGSQVASVSWGEGAHLRVNSPGR